MSNEERFDVPPTCPNSQTCALLGYCFARQLLDHELNTRIPPVPGISVPSQHEAVESLMRAAKCTDSGFIQTLWRALEFLILTPRNKE